jgi:ubiquinone/menaquinone biosynthesis C-methylase UbiE
MEQDDAAQVARWAGMFDTVAPVYDQSGVPFFGTIAAGLVAHLAPAAGERVLDVGAGRGAATVRLAEAVGPTARVHAVDISPAMVGLLCREVAALPHVEVTVGDATDPPVAPGSCDVVASSLVLFFLPDPEAALRRWLRLLVPGGRVGATTFRPWPPTWRAVEDVFEEYAPPAPAGAGPGPTAMPEAYGTDAGVESLFRAAGASGVRTEGATYDVPFRDVEQWREWSMGTAMRGLWMRTPPECHPEITQRVGGILDAAGGRLQVAVRYTLGRA